MRRIIFFLSGSVSLRSRQNTTLTPMCAIKIEGGAVLAFMAIVVIDVNGIYARLWELNSKMEHIY